MASKEKKLPTKQKSGGQSELMQRFKANPFVFIGTFFILIIIILAFVLVPALGSGNERAYGEMTFGYYNKTPISYVTDNYFYKWQQTMASWYQQDITEDNYLYVLYEIWYRAYREAVIQAGKLDEMKQAGYTAPQDRVEREVALMPQFQENGRFSAIKYRQLNNNTRMNLLDMTQDEITADRYDSDFYDLTPSSREAAFISSMASPQRSFNMVSFYPGSFPDSEIAAFAAENAALFRAVQLSRITVNSSERDARLILASIQGGTITFEDAARASSQDYDAERGGEMGSRMAYELEYYIPGERDREEVSRLTQGRFSDVIQVGERSWTFFRADENPRPADLNDAVTMDRIRSYIFSYEWGRAEDWAIAEAEKFIAAAKDRGFSSAAMDMLLDIDSFGPLPVNYGDLDIFPSLATTGIPVEKAEIAGTSEQFWRAAFSTPLLTPSVPVVIGNSVAVLYPLEEIQSDPEMAVYLESYFESILPEHTNTAIRSYFLTNDKLDDRFMDTFLKNWGY